jgi:hypothetical protein
MLRMRSNRALQIITTYTCSQLFVRKRRDSIHDALVSVRYRLRRNDATTAPRAILEAFGKARGQLSVHQYTSLL